MKVLNINKMLPEKVTEGNKSSCCPPENEGHMNALLTAFEHHFEHILKLFNT